MRSIHPWNAEKGGAEAVRGNKEVAGLGLFMTFFFADNLSDPVLLTFITACGDAYR